MTNKRKDGGIFIVDTIVSPIKSQSDQYLGYVSIEYDVLFLDVRLPDGSGIDAIPDIQSISFPPEIIIITAYSDKGGAQTESILFGHIKGSFTGADSDRVGLIKEADVTEARFFSMKSVSFHCHCKKPFYVFFRKNAFDLSAVKMRLKATSGLYLQPIAIFR